MDKYFLGFAIAKLLKNKVDVRFSPTKTVQYDAEEIKCSGYFQSDPPELAVAIGKPTEEWFKIFIHEYCHFLQWQSGYELWDNIEDDKLWGWLDCEITLTKKEAKRVAALSRELELDCEKRVVELIQQYELSIDVKQYIKAANSYVLFYNILAKTRTWYVKPPYTVKEVMDTVPDYFLKNYDRMPKGYEAAVMKYCYEN